MIINDGQIMVWDSAERDFVPGDVGAIAGGPMTNPMTGVGDTVYGGISGAVARLAANSTTTKKFLSETGTGSAGNAPSWSTVTNSDVGLGSVTNDAQVKRSEMGAALGVATLDASAKVPLSQLPDTVIGAVDYQGTWNASTNSPNLGSLSPSKGDYYVVSADGSTSLGGITDWKQGDWAIYNGTVWQKVDNTDAVFSVFGRFGAVVATSGDYSFSLISGTALVNQGGTGATTLASNGILYGNGTSAIQALAVNSSGTNKFLTQSSSSAPAWAILSDADIPATLVRTSRLLTAGAGLTGGGDLSADRTFNVGAGAGIVVNADDVAIGTPSTLGVGTTNAAVGSTHGHAVTWSSNPGAASNLLGTDASGYLQLVRLGIGTAPTQPLEVSGNVLLSGSTANLFLKNTTTGFQASVSGIVNPQSGNDFRSNSFTSGLIGWNISDGGNAEFANVDVRGAIHSSVFVYNALLATAGTLGVFKSAAKLIHDLPVPSSPTYGTTAVNIDVQDQDGLTHAASQLFNTLDIIHFRLWVWLTRLLTGVTQRLLKLGLTT